MWWTRRIIMHNPYNRIDREGLTSCSFRHLAKFRNGGTGIFRSSLVVVYRCQRHTFDLHHSLLELDVSALPFYTDIARDCIIIISLLFFLNLLFLKNPHGQLELKELFKMSIDIYKGIKYDIWLKQVEVLTNSDLTAYGRLVVAYFIIHSKIPTPMFFLSWKSKGPTQREQQQEKRRGRWWIASLWHLRLAHELTVVSSRQCC